MGLLLGFLMYQTLQTNKMADFVRAWGGERASGSSLTMVQRCPRVGLFIYLFLCEKPHPASRLGSKQFYGRAGEWDVFDAETLLEGSDASLSVYQAALR